MSAITTELSVELFKEFGCWFGGPALLTVEPGLATEASRDFILDGLTRFRGLQQCPELLAQWQAGKLPHHVFHGATQRTADTQKLLPRLLVLGGHYDRAHEHTPEQWRQSVPDLMAYLRVPSADAFAVFACRHQVRKAYVRQVHRNDPIMANRAIVRYLRQLVTTADETGFEVSIDSIREVLFYGPPSTQRRTANDSDSLHNVASTVHEDSGNDGGS